ncbi:hypothetical protein F5Y05DRAFT_323176 [Hypoxylon sp. FL0543]|nr:hypothetical protein F5Y05DRAFT_323176 [Hypoxylon sp. FL0543]
MSQSPASSSLSPPEPPPPPSSSPTRKRTVDTSSDEEERPSASKVSRLMSSELTARIDALRMNSSPTFPMSDVSHEPETTAAAPGVEQASELPVKPKWHLRYLSIALKLQSLQASLPGLQQILQAVKAGISAPEGQTREETKLAKLTSDALLEQLTEIDEDILILQDETIQVKRQEDAGRWDTDEEEGEKGISDDFSDEELAAQVRSIVAEASGTLERIQQIADKTLESNDGGVRNALEWWKTLAKHSP